MKTFKAHTGPFKERPYFTPQEIESICLSELQAKELLPLEPGPIRIDRFIEKKYNITPQYENMGNSILGYTIFSQAGVQAMMINRSLDEENSQASERRIRSTLAHEAGHCLLHTHLFVNLSSSKPLFADYQNPQRPKVLCRDVLGHEHSESLKPYDGRWWEFQANSVIGSLLLPRLLLEKALEPYKITTGLLGVKQLDPTKRTLAINSIVDIFNINPIVAKIRLNDLYPIAKETQMSI